MRALLFLLIFLLCFSSVLAAVRENYLIKRSYINLDPDVVLDREGAAGVQRQMQVIVQEMERIRPSGSARRLSWQQIAELKRLQSLLNKAQSNLSLTEMPNFPTQTAMKDMRARIKAKADARRVDAQRRAMTKPPRPGFFGRFFSILGPLGFIPTTEIAHDVASAKARAELERLKNKIKQSGWDSLTAEEQRKYGELITIRDFQGGGVIPPRQRSEGF